MLVASELPDGWLNIANNTITVRLGDGHCTFALKTRHIVAGHASDILQWDFVTTSEEKFPQVREITVFNL